MKVKQLSSKKSAIAATQKPAKSKPIKAKKPAKAAKPKKKSGATVAAKSKKAIQAEAKNQALELQLNKDADAAMQKLTEGIPDLLKRGENLHAVMEDVKKRELWRKGSNPFKSQSDFLNHFASMAHVSIRTLQGTMGAIKALPGVSAAKRQAIGPRKLAALGKAARNLRESTGDEGANLPDEIIDAALDRTEAEVHADLVARKLIIEDEPEDDIGEVKFGEQGGEPEPEYNRVVLGGEDASGQFYSVPADGDYGRTEPIELGQDQVHIEPAEVPEHHKSAMQKVHEFFGATPEAEDAGEIRAKAIPFGEETELAIAEARLIYGEEEEHRPDSDWIEFCLTQWRKTGCFDDIHFPNMTNAQAADSIKQKPKKSNGKKKERKP